MITNDENVNQKTKLNFVKVLAIVLLLTLGSFAYYNLNYGRNDFGKKGKSSKEASQIAEAKKLLGEGQYIKAIEVLDEYISGDQQNDEAYFLLAQANESIGKTKPAIASYQKALSINPENADYHYNLAVNHKTLKNYEEAIKELEKAIKINSNLTGAKLIMAEIYFEQKEYNKAIKIYSDIIKQKPFGVKLDEIYVNRGKNYQMLKKLKEAKVSWEEALKINPQNSEAKELIAKNP